MMDSPLYVAFGVVINFALWLIFVRFMLQFADINKKHPYVKAAYTLSAIVDVFANIFPTVGKGRVSTSALALLLLLWLIGIAGRASLLGESLTALQLFFMGTMTAIIMFLTALKWTIFVSILCSFIVMFSQKIHPIVDILMDIANPIIEPFRKISPNLGMIDIAPMFAILTLVMSSKIVEIISREIWRSIGG